jgi:mRNA-degrading endonuclease toxin of MazEF toxin-antitoxin module
VKQGEIWELPGLGKVLVVSSDAHNASPQNAPVIVPIVRGHGEPSGAAIALTGADPVSGVILSTLVTAIDRPPSGVGTLVGMVTGKTMHHVAVALEELFTY